MESKNIRVRGTIAFLSLLLTLPMASPQATANTLCADGTISRSTGSGTCSWHGGIAGGSSPSKKNNGFGVSDPWGTTSTTKKNNGFGVSDPWGTTSTKKKCSSLDRFYGLC